MTNSAILMTPGIANTPNSFLARFTVIHNSNDSNADLRLKMIEIRGFSLVLFCINSESEKGSGEGREKGYSQVLVLLIIWWLQTHQGTH